MSLYRRTLDELREKAVLHWPEDLLMAASKLSALPVLLDTQDAFISLLKIADKNPLSWKEMLLQSSALTGPCFLKHLMVLTDLGGEALNKLPPLSDYIPEGKLQISWQEKIFEYSLKTIHKKCSLSNTSLKVSSANIIKGGELTDTMIDVAMILLFGSSLTNDSLPIEVKEKCVIGSLIGNGPEIERFVKQNYIRVSRQVGGATANELGSQVQNYVYEKLKEALNNDWTITRQGKLPGVTHREGDEETSFDIVAKSPEGNYFGVEVSFQVTTNSLIERKSREAEALKKSVSKAGHKICYVIDGAGNINIRTVATSNICDFSDCTVALSHDEIKVLSKFMTRNA